MSRPPADRLFGVNVALTVLATLVIAIVGYGGAAGAQHPVAVASPAATPEPPVAAAPYPVEPTPPSSPPRLSVRGFDLVDARTGWILLSNCVQPMTGMCQYFVAATADGGQMLSTLVQVGPPVDPGDGTPRMVRFMNATDGFVYSGTGAFATHDGGKTWNTLNVQATFFEAITGRGQTAWAVTYPCVKGAPLCAFEVRVSHDGGRSWSVPRPLPIGYSPSEIIRFGTSGGLVSGPSSGDLEITSDGGVTWRQIKGQCLASFRAFVASPDGKEIWELCMSYPAGASADKVLFVSEDGGKSWSQKASSLDFGKLPALGTQVSLISTRPGMLLLATEQTPLFLTRDAAASWIQVATSPPGGISPRFANANDGWAMDTRQQAIWSTGDGGTSWTLLPAYTPTP